MNCFYVYAYCHPITEQPFYIGKGHEDRAMFHSKYATSNYFKNKHFKHTILKIRRELNREPLIKLLKDNMLEADALQLEIELIAKYGRKLFEPNGILCNLTLGGDGVSGYRHTAEAKKKMSKNKVMTPEIREKYRLASTGRVTSEATKAKLRAYKHSEETKQRISTAHKGTKKPKTAEQRANISTRQSKKWLITFPDGHQEVILNRKAFCEAKNIPTATLQFGRHGWSAIKLND